MPILPKKWGGIGWVLTYESFSKVVSIFTYLLNWIQALLRMIAQCSNITYIIIKDICIGLLYHLNENIFSTCSFHPYLYPPYLIFVTHSDSAALNGY